MRMEKKWIFPEEGELQPDRMEGVSPVLTGLLAGRGLTGEASVREYLSEKPLLTYDPFAMKDMEAAARKILEGVREGKTICIYGDYDADGVCSISLLLDILGLFNARCFFYIPSRFEEGYGLNKEALRTVRERGADLVVTVDCGSVSYEEVEYGKELGLEMIVTDHHNVGDGGGEEPRAADCLLVNPKQGDCCYPDSGLSGCGVAFKLAQALQRVEQRDSGGESKISKKDLNRVLDLVALATIGDIVPLVGENRTLVKYGMRVVNSSRRPGLRRLIQGAGLTPGEIKSENVAYVIVPHLNAAGRLLSAETAVTLLHSREEAEIEKAARVLLENNKERKKIQEETFLKVADLVEQDCANDGFLLVRAPFAHEGIAGIVAGKIKEMYYRPTILVTPSGEGMLKGTGRSIEGVNLYEMLASCSHLFLRFGGHSAACGFLMKEEGFPALKEALEKEVERRKEKTPDLFSPHLRIDWVLQEREITLKLAREMERMGPFGHKNEKPLLCIRGVKPVQIAYMGEQKQHMRFQGRGIEYVLFSRAREYKERMRDPRPLDLAGSIDINKWNEKEKIQFVIADLR